MLRESDAERAAKEASNDAADALAVAEAEREAAVARQKAEEKARAASIAVYERRRAEEKEEIRLREEHAAASKSLQPERPDFAAREKAEGELTELKRAHFEAHDAAEDAVSASILAREKADALAYARKKEKEAKAAQEALEMQGPSGLSEVRALTFTAKKLKAEAEKLQQTSISNYRIKARK